MCSKRSFIVLVFIFLLLHINAQMWVTSDPVLKFNSTDSLLVTHKSPLKIVGWAVATNIAVWSIDRFVVAAPYAHINFKTINNNFKSAFVWDDDMFETNLFAHPYHGNYYYNAARCNGMNFWQSIPYTTGGSLVWEFCMENEAPSINDLLSTTIGGICLGEMSFRISDLLIDDRALGFDRFKREGLLFLFSPIRGLNRLLSGDAWKHRKFRGNSLPSTPHSFYSTIGVRVLADNSLRTNDMSAIACYDFGFYYGNPYNPENEKPYDFFSLQVGGNFLSQQPVISHFNGLGLLFSKSIDVQKLNTQLLFGVFQHFNYYHAHKDLNNKTLNSYQISEAASVGTGLLFKTKLSGNISFSSSGHLSAILLGGSQTDHYKSENKDYNMGNGFSAKLNLELQFGKKANVLLKSEYYRIYPWIGNNNATTQTTYTTITAEDNGNASLSLLSLNFNYMIHQHFLLSFETSYYNRRSVYDHYPVVNHSVTDNKVSVGYVF